MSTKVDGWDFSPGNVLTPGQVADLFAVDPKTVTRWAQAGRLVSITTLGGHRRFSREQIDAIRTGSVSTGTPRPHRDQRDGLTGHTVSIERLTVAAARKAGTPELSNQVVIVERTDGRLGQVLQAAADVPDETTIEDAARAYADKYDAQYLGAE